jgi:hypothetical protein
MDFGPSMRGLVEELVPGTLGAFGLEVDEYVSTAEQV